MQFNFPELSMNQQVFFPEAAAQVTSPSFRHQTEGPCGFLGQLPAAVEAEGRKRSMVQQLQASPTRLGTLNSRKKSENGDFSMGKS